MRKKRRNRQQDQSNSPGESSTRAKGADDAATVSGPESKARRTWFRLAAVLLPFILLLFLELSLRLFGYGYPTDFFLRKSANGSPVLIQNQQFGWRFFPPAVARSPEPIYIPGQKSTNDLRIFLFGESAAMGDPEPAYGMARQLERMLKARFPTKQVQVVNVAMTAINSHVIREIARDCRKRKGDIWIVYSGNNEVVGPYGAGTVFGHQAPPLWWVRTLLAVKTTRIGQLLAAAATPRTAAPAEWMGMEFFLKEQVTATDSRLPRVYAGFESNLGDIINQGRRAGAKVLVSTVAVNLKDCPPFASLHRAGLSPGALQTWQQHFQAGCEAESRGQHAEALRSYQQAETLDPQHAELVFRLARCELATGDAAAAKHFQLARDLDTLRFRADSILNASTRRLARKMGATLIDAEEACALRAAKDLPGDDLFYDHVHLNFTGNYTVARLFAQEIEKQLGSTSNVPLLTEDDVRQRLAFTAFDQHRVTEEMRLRLQQPPFNAQINHAERDERSRNLLATRTNSPANDATNYTTALTLAPKDWILHANFARLLDAAGDVDGAAHEWQQVAKLMPFEPGPRYELANIYAARRSPEAEALFREAIERSVNPVEALNGLGLLKAEQGDARAALSILQRALRLAPNSSDTRINIGVVQARQGNLEAAKEQYLAVLRADTNNVPARVNLAKVLGQQQDWNAAIALYSECLALKPGDPIVHFNLANALLSQNRIEEAIFHYRTALATGPVFGEADYSLALALTKVGRVNESLEHFQRAVRSMPDSAEAHFNYGIALAKQQKFGEAVAQFEAVLKLQPDHAAARAALERASKLR